MKDNMKNIKIMTVASSKINHTTNQSVRLAIRKIRRLAIYKHNEKFIIFLNHNNKQHEKYYNNDLIN